MKDIQSASSVSRIKSHFCSKEALSSVVSFHKPQLTVLNMPFLAVVFVGV